MVRESIGRSLQTVVHVDGLHLAGPTLGTSEQQRGGIGAAAQAHRQRQRRNESR